MNQVKTYQAGVRAAGRWELLDGDRTLAVVENWEQLKKALSSVPERAFSPNTIVNLVSPQGDTLSIGIAGLRDRDNANLTEPVACLNFTSASGNVSCLTIVGAPSLTYENGGVVVFRFEEDTWTEILRRNCVSLETMFKVVQHFYQSGVLPDWISWEEV